MIYHKVLRKIRNRIAQFTKRNPNAFLRDCHAILHIGANEGQERAEYAKLGLEVLWVEALPEAFSRLSANIKDLPNQHAVLALITDEVGKTFQFNVASNSGASSSIFQFHSHVALWPGISFVDKIELQSTTLAVLLSDLGLQPDHFDAAIIDVQGAELLVLRGSLNVLANLTWVRCEASDFESYAGACNVEQLVDFMSSQSFKLIRQEPFASKPGVGTYYELTFRKV